MITDHRTLWAAGDLYKFLALGSETNGAYSLWHAVVPPGGGPPLHVHFNEDERFDVLSGKLTFWLGKDALDEEAVMADPRAFGAKPLDTVAADAGTSLYSPRGYAHGFRNTSDVPAEMLLHLTPGGMEEFFADPSVGVLYDPQHPNPPPPPSSPEAKAAIAAAAARFNVILLGPTPELQ